MNILDDLNKIKQIDKSNVLGSILDLNKQCRHAYTEVNANKDFKKLSGIKHLLMSGMGGSGLAARVIKPLFKNEITIPLELVNSYTLPNWVNQNSFVLVSSYSGNTEETLSTAYEAKKRGAHIFAICAGGQLYQWSKDNNIPVYKINPKYNACGQPRMAIGYSIFGQLSMLIKAGILNLSEDQIQTTIKFLEKRQNDYLLERKFNNPAKQLAISLVNSIPILIGSAHISGALHVSKNQLNENAKTFALLFNIPELNHHLMEGLRFPESNQNTLRFIFYNSDLYPSQIQKRFKLTDDVVKKNNIKTSSFSLKGKDRFTQAFETIQFGAFWQYYLTILHQVDPAPIPWVDYFKKHL